MRVTVGAIMVLGLIPLGLRLGAQERRAAVLPFVLLQAGTLNPNDLLQATLSYGAGAGLAVGQTAFALHVTRQSQNRNSGADLTGDARTFVTVIAERSLGQQRGMPLRQAFVRLDAGALFRAPLRTALVTGIGLGWRFHLIRHVTLVGALFDDVAWIPAETSSCPAPGPFGGTTSCVVQADAQHNFGGTVALQLHP